MTSVRGPGVASQSPRDLEVRTLQPSSERDRRDLDALAAVAGATWPRWERAPAGEPSPGAAPLPLGAFAAGRLVAAVALLPHDLLRRGRSVRAFQVGSPVVSPGSDATRTTNALLDRARRELGDAAFLFALVKDETRHLFTASGFLDHGGFLEARVPRGRLGAALALRRFGPSDYLLVEDGYRQNDAHLLAACRAGDPSVRSFASDGNILWGKRSGNAFDAFGLIVADARHFPRLVAESLAATGASSARFRLHRTSGFRALFRMSTPSRGGVRLLVRDLAITVRLGDRFHFTDGPPP